MIYICSKCGKEDTAQPRYYLSGIGNGLVLCNTCSTNQLAKNVDMLHVRLMRLENKKRIHNARTQSQQIYQA